jgi:hypothetical protein
VGAWRPRRALQPQVLPVDLGNKPLWSLIDIAAVVRCRTLSGQTTMLTVLFSDLGSTLVVT